VQRGEGKWRGIGLQWMHVKRLTMGVVGIGEGEESIKHFIAIAIFTP
jgi:hypothetical protein